jgi:alanine racemase
MGISAPTVAKVNLSAVAHNYRRLRGLLPAGTRLSPVVKADAYGHGAAEVGRALWAEGAGWFTVATLDEGLALRRALPDADILVLVPALPGLCSPAELAEAADAVVSARLRTTVADPAAAEALDSAAARARGAVASPLPVHVEIDTGLGRGGVPAEEAPALLARVAACRHLRLEGVFTHFAEADSDDPAYSRRQLDTFHAALAAFRFGPAAETAGTGDDSGCFGLSPRYVPDAPGSLASSAGQPEQTSAGGGLLLHTANSAGTLRLPESRMGLVRCGLAIYGHSPDAEPRGLLPAMRVVSRLALVKRLPAGHPVGYDRTWTAGRPTVTGVIPIGYEDGYPRALSNNAVMTVRGRAVPVIGRVSMDQTVVDLTDVPGAAVGDEVTVISDDAAAPNSMAALAERAGTIPYELLCRLGNRVRRVYG